jgi:hypothetical protein
MQWHNVALAYLIALAPVCATALTALVSLGVAYMRHRYRWAREAHLSDEVDAIVRAVVAEAQQTIVDRLKASRPERKLTIEEGLMVKQQVTAKIERLMTGRQRRTLQRCTSDFDGWIAARIEEALLEQKIRMSGPAAAGERSQQAGESAATGGRSAPQSPGALTRLARDEGWEWAGRRSGE